MRKSQLPPDALEYFRQEGARGGKIGGSLGGKKAAASMTAKQRSARARKAGKAGAAARKVKEKK